MKKEHKEIKMMGNAFQIIPKVCTGITIDINQYKHAVLTMFYKEGETGQNHLIERVVISPDLIEQTEKIFIQLVKDLKEVDTHE